MSNLNTYYNKTINTNKKVEVTKIKVKLYSSEYIDTYLEYHFYATKLYNIICVQKTNINKQFISSIKFGLNNIKIEDNGCIILNGKNYYTKAGVYVENINNKIDIIITHEILDNIQKQYYNNISLYDYLINFDYII